MMWDENEFRWYGLTLTLTLTLALALTLTFALTLTQAAPPLRVRWSMFCTRLVRVLRMRMSLMVASG